MVAVSLFLLVLLFLAVGAALRADGRNGLELPAMVLFAAAAQVAVLIVANEVIPFTVGDDLSYYAVSLRRFHSLGGWFNLQQFPDYAQGGFPLLLAWVHQFAGDSLFARKALNLFFFLLLAVVWFHIGRELGGRRMGLTFAAAMLMATPFWAYWIWLLKDMSIVLLQSVFLLGMVRMNTRGADPRTWLLLGASTVLLIPLRLPVVLINGGVAVATVIFTGQGSLRRKLGMLAGSGVLVAGLLYVGTRANLLAAFGVSGNALDFATLKAQYDLYLAVQGGATGVRWAVVFPVLFVFGETSGFQLGSLLATDPSMAVRGLTALPWIFAGAPFFVWGVLRLVKPLPSMELAMAGEGHARNGPVRVPASRWTALLVFLIAYVAVAWVVHNTTRWRMPSLPVMVALAAYGWMAASARVRFNLLAGWLSVLCVAFALYYMLGA